MAQYQCPHCPKVFASKASLNAHIKRMHPEPAGDPGGPGEPGENNFDVQPPPAEKKPYHCLNCGEPLSKGQNPCPRCGEALDWSGLNDEV